MHPLYPELEPYTRSMLPVGGADLLYWKACGSPHGNPAVVLHGGPGSGCTSWHRRLFDPERYRIILFDQRNCGRSRPHASDPEIDLSGNTTEQLIGDIDRLRRHLGVPRWLVLGGSGGSALALAYAERFPGDVFEMVLFGVTTGRRRPGSGACGSLPRYNGRPRPRPTTCATTAGWVMDGCCATSTGGPPSLQC